MTFALQHVSWDQPPFFAEKEEGRLIAGYAACGGVV